jgi:hypothetical protein
MAELVFPELLPVALAARILGVDPRTLRRWCVAQPELAVSIGGRLRIRRVALERLLAEPEARPRASA